MKITWRESIADGNYYASVPRKRGTKRDTRDWYSRGTNVMIIPTFYFGIEGQKFLIRAGNSTVSVCDTLYRAKVRANKFIRTMQGQHDMCEGSLQ